VEFNCQTVSGDLTLDTPLQPASHNVARTVSGNLHLRVPAGTGATVQMKSVSGTVRSDLPAEIIRSGRRHWQGRINGGGAEVELTTVSGDLTVEHSNTGGAVQTDTQAPVAEDGESSRAATTEVLERLHRGEISVEQATEMLRAGGRQ
jgi:DUF4097 and DUF4098 domain-containing protein YvlB